MATRSSTAHRGRSATSVTFDGSSSSSTSANVQEALDELFGQDGELVAYVDAQSTLNTTETAYLNGTTETDIVLTEGVDFQGAGEYLVEASLAVENSTSADVLATVFVAGSEIVGAERPMRGSTTGAALEVSLLEKVTVAAGDDIEVHWRVSSGTGTMKNRSLSLWRV